MRLTDQVHLKLNDLLCAGDTAIDATAGNGHDTLAMAKLVGPTGTVIAIDLQAGAIGATRAQLEAAGQSAQCQLIEGDHAEALKDLLEQGILASAITFNLGYFPGGDKAVTTTPQTTLSALNSAKSLLGPRGLILVTAYRGHEGGIEEAAAVESWMQSLPDRNWHIEISEPVTRQANRVPPILRMATRV